MAASKYPFLEARGALVSLHVQIAPRAKKSKILGMHGDKLKVAVAAPPVDGKANKALIDFLAKSLECAKNKIGIKKGELCRDKVVVIEGVDIEHIAAILDEALCNG